MAEWTPATQKRVTFLSVFETLEGDYDASVGIVEQLEEDGFFDKGKSRGRSSERSERSGGRDSGSRSSNRGGGRGRGGGGKMRDPDGPPTQKQVDTVLKYGDDDFTEDELWDMSKEEISEIIEDMFDN